MMISFFFYFCALSYYNIYLISYLSGASRGQRGFLGCMRALRINGVTFDLKEKAKVTPGVNPGCQGHCSSYRTQCRNGGKCVEQYNGYSCDCTLTAYDGPSCTDGNCQLPIVPSGECLYDCSHPHNFPVDELMEGRRLCQIFMVF